jgi:hypothetical protein
MKTVEKDDFIIFKNTISSDMKFGIIKNLKYCLTTDDYIIELIQFNKNNITKTYYNNCYKENILDNFGKMSIEEFCSKYPEYFI